MDKQGHRTDYSSAYLRRTYRDAGKVKNETVANLSALPDHVIDWIDAGLKGQHMVPAACAVTITGSLPHGHVAAIHAMAWRDDVTLGADLGVTGASTDDIYAAMDWLRRRQDAIEAALARRHLAPEANPPRMALSSSWMVGRCCPLTAPGYSRDGKKGKLQIEYGLLTDPEGRPVAVRVFPGSTGDPAAFTAIADVVRTIFGLQDMAWSGTAA